MKVFTKEFREYCRKKRVFEDLIVNTLTNMLFFFIGAVVGMLTLVTICADAVLRAVR
jgi:hypothetical protein